MKKFRGRSAQEMRARGRQELAKIGERLFTSNLAEMTDRAFLAEVAPAFRNRSAEATASLIIERQRDAISRSAFFPAVTRRAQIASIMENRFAREREALIDRAERARAGRFDLFGHKNISFGDPIDWRLEPLSGKRTPLDHWSRISYLDPEIAGDKKLTWELNRHNHFVTLGQAYCLTSDERYAESFVAQASEWMDENPPHRGINWASSLELAFRSIAWLWALNLFKDSQRLTPRFMLRLLKFLIAHARHIDAHLSYYFSPNTHLTGEALGLFYLGAMLPELRRAGEWKEKGLGILLEQLPLQVGRDGVYFEQATYYHRYTADFYIHLLTLARALEIKLPEEVDARLALLLDHLMWLTKPGGASPLIGDDDGGRLIEFGKRAGNDFRDTLAVGAAMFGREDWKYVAGNETVELLWLLGPETLARYDVLKARPARERSRPFSESGFYIMRDGWAKDSGYVIVDGGPHGALGCGHAHADALAFEFASRGVNWLVDPGTFTYTGDARLRDLFRATGSHNTVTVDGESQSVPSGPFAWSDIAEVGACEFITANSFDYFEGSHDGYTRLADPVTHTRSLLFVKSFADGSIPSYLIVRDGFAAKKHHLYKAMYHFSPECVVTSEENQILATGPNAERLNIIAFGSVEPAARVMDGWVSACYGVKHVAPVAAFEIEGEARQELFTCLMPSAKGESISIKRQVATGFDGFGASIEVGEFFDVLVAGDSSEAQSKGVGISGAIGLARFAKGALACVCLIRGKKIEVANHFALISPEAFKYLEAQIGGAQIEISIDGASRFALTFAKPIQAVVVNGERFKVDSRSRSATFALEGTGWKLSAEGV